jgi:hypothetical protein
MKYYQDELYPDNIFVVDNDAKPYREQGKDRIDVTLISISESYRSYRDQADPKFLRDSCVELDEITAKKLLGGNKR